MKKFLHQLELKNVSSERKSFNFQKRLRKIYSFLILLLVIAFTAVNSSAQTAPLPKDHPIKIAAPNLPSMERAVASADRVFHGEKFTYAYGNEAKVKEWMTNYPSELEAYKIAIQKFLAEADLNTMADEQKDLYYDLKNQWVLISQTNN